MTHYELFLKSLDIYFWVYLVYLIVNLIIITYSDDYKINKENAIANGTFYSNGNSLTGKISLVLFILSIQLT